MKHVSKVLIYLVHRGHLLVFEHPNAADAGLQVPAGTVKDGEELPIAARRELLEETGIEASAFRPLGKSVYDMAAFGRDEIHERSFFLAEKPFEEQLTDRRWQHLETHDGVGEPDVLELYWLPLDTPGLATKLAAGHGALLGTITT